MALIREVLVQNFKSIRSLHLALGRVNVLIGENGSGKTNWLEAVAYGVAAVRRKLDNEYLSPRGIRVTEPRFMRAAFDRTTGNDAIVLHITDDAGHEHKAGVGPAGTLRTIADSWGDAVVEAVGAGRAETALKKSAALVVREPRQPEFLRLDQPLRDLSDEDVVALVESIKPARELIERALAATRLPDFLIYAPENSSLRIFQNEGQLLPLGVKGEGLFAHLKALSSTDGVRFDEIARRLALLDWFEHIEIPKDLAPGERSLLIRDRFLAEGALFDQRSANEGFLYLLFYLTLFISNATPAFFAIDNVDSSLNPKLCTTAVRQLIELATEHGKQIILTTHNPAVLDALDLSDEEQRLFVFERAKGGETKARRVRAPRPLDADTPVKLSEAFVHGYLGGLPKNF